MESNNILICGYARSGNTLMLNLICNGFHNMYQLRGEAFPDKVIIGKTVVGKKPIGITSLKKYINRYGILAMIRDPRAVMTSKHLPLNQKYIKNQEYWVQPERWIDAAKQIHRYRDKILIIKYEDLITNSKKVQDTIALYYDLEIKLPFEECYKYFEDNDANINCMRGIRPLEKSRLNSWKNNEDEKKYLKDNVLNNKDIIKYMKIFGYEIGVS